MKLSVNRLLFVLLLLVGVVCPRVQAVGWTRHLENGDGAAALAWTAGQGFAVQPAATAFVADCCGYDGWHQGALQRQASGQWGRTDEASGASCDYAARQDIWAVPSIAAGTSERSSLGKRMAGWLYAELGHLPTAPPNCPAYVYDACRVFTRSSFAAENAASFRPWEIGDSITKALPDGSYPKWFSSAAADKAATVQGRYWMNRAAASAPVEFTTRQLAQMRSGFAPQAMVVVRKMANGVPGPELVQTISKELHQNLRNRGVPGFDEPLHLREVWPWQHELIDQFRHTGYEFVRFAD